MAQLFLLTLVFAQSGHHEGELDGTKVCRRDLGVHLKDKAKTRIEDYSKVGAYSLMLSCIDNHRQE